VLSGPSLVGESPPWASFVRLAAVELVAVGADVTGWAVGEFADLGRPCNGVPDEYMHLVAARERLLGEVAAVVAGDAGDERGPHTFHHDHSIPGRGLEVGVPGATAQRPSRATGYGRIGCACEEAVDGSLSSVRFSPVQER
jgi:hypothetical protein